MIENMLKVAEKVYSHPPRINQVSISINRHLGEFTEWNCTATLQWHVVSFSARMFALLAPPSIFLHGEVSDYSAIGIATRNNIRSPLAL